jgi:hypothetical protein
VLKKIKLQEAVGSKLAHDITEIRPGGFARASSRDRLSARVTPFATRTFAISSGWEKTSST